MSDAGAHQDASMMRRLLKAPHVAVAEGNEWCRIDDAAVVESPTRSDSGVWGNVRIDLRWSLGEATVCHSFISRLS